MSDKFVNLSVSRRTLMKGGALAAAAAASPCLPNLAFAEQIKKLEQEGWTKRPVACTMCGAFCGLIEMRKEGEPVSEKTVRISQIQDILNRATAADPLQLCGFGITRFV